MYVVEAKQASLSPVQKKAWDLRPKSHKNLTEIKKEASYIKKGTAKHHRKNTAKIQTDQINMAFGPITSCFSVERDFSNVLSHLE